MLIKIFIFLTGLILTIIGLVFIIIYLNLLTIGYNFNNYVNFISSRFECIIFILGILIMILSTKITERRTK